MLMYHTYLVGKSSSLRMTETENGNVIFYLLAQHSLSSHWELKNVNA